MKFLLTLLLLIPSLSWGMTIKEFFEILVNTKIEIILEWIFKGLCFFVLLCVIYFVWAWILDKNSGY